jgi:hypothetical protein
VKNAEEIDGKTELLTLTAPKALEYGVARAVVKNRGRALAFPGAARWRDFWAGAPGA